MYPGHWPGLRMGQIYANGYRIVSLVEVKLRISSEGLPLGSLLWNWGEGSWTGQGEKLS